MPDETTQKFDVTKFCLSAYVATFKDTLLGGTDGPPSFKLEPTFFESKCDQAGETVLRKILTGMKIVVSMSMKEIETGMGLILGESGKIQLSDIGKDLFADKGALVLTPIGMPGLKSYRFPGAMLLMETEYKLSGTEEHVLPVSFECVPDANGVIMERVD